MTTEDEELEQEESSPVNALELSDEDIANMPFPEDEITTEVEEPNEEETTDELEEISTEESDEIDTDADDTDDQGQSEESDEEEIEEKEILATEDDGEEVKETATTDEATSDIDYEAAYKQLTATFRANGKDIQVNSVEDAITLMKMGANYNKKMAGLKPNLRLMKMLENNNLLDESKLTYLIDLDKKDPEAIKKFIKDSGVDPLDIDTEKDTNYRPGTYTVDDKEVDIDGVLDSIRDTPSFATTIDIISNKWDKSSKEVLYGTPGLITTLNEQVGTGIYDQINAVVESERMLGRLTGLSDIEAYKQIGDAIQARGGFDDKSSIATEPSKPAAKPADSPKLKNRKRAASSTKSAPTKKKVADYNPLSLSDEDFDKIGNSALM